MRNFQRISCILLLGLFFLPKADARIRRNSKGSNPKEVQFWLTDPTAGIYFQKQNYSGQFGATPSSANTVIEVDADQSYQTMDGFGNCLTDGSAILLTRMSAVARATLLKELFAWDKNNIGISYPLTILRDPEAAKYVDGSAFHLYGGMIEALSDVHKEFPDKNLYFTEQWIGSPANFPGDLAWHTKTLIIGASRNWCRNVLEWNMASDPDCNPHTEGGCDRCLGTITLNGDQVTRNPAYYILAHAAKFVRPGSIRIASNVVENLPNVAFKTESGKIVLIVLNESQESKKFSIANNGKAIEVELGKGAVSTFVW